MTKKYNVIPIEDYYVVVEKKENYKVNKGEYYYHDYYGGYRIASSSGWGTWDIMIATIGKRIDSLPLIEIPEQKIEQLANLAANKLGYGKEDMDDGSADFISGFNDGYKAATKTYTKEDMKACWNAAALKKVSDSEYNNDEIPNFSEFIKSLKKPISSVELEVEYVIEDFSGSDSIPTYADLPTLKVSETNTVTPINVFYE